MPVVNVSILYPISFGKVSDRGWEFSINPSLSWSGHHARVYLWVAVQKSTETAYKLQAGRHKPVTPDLHTYNAQH